MSNKYFFYIGNAYPHKNLEILIEAMVLLNTKRSEKVVLKISSSRSVFTKRLEDLINKSKAKEYVELLGFVPDAEIGDLYKKSVAFVFPTLSEGFGLPPMEAIEAGAMVVQSDIPVLKEVYQDSALYFDPADINSIVNSLEKVLGMGESERRKKIQYAQKFVKRYSWAKMAKETLAIYENFK